MCLCERLGVCVSVFVSMFVSVCVRTRVCVIVSVYVCVGTVLCDVIRLLCVTSRGHIQHMSVCQLTYTRSTHSTR